MNSSPIYVGMHGNVFCLDRNTGQQIWGAGLAGSEFVTLLLEDDRIFAVTHGEVFALDIANGSILWRNNMPGQGYGIASLATATRSTNPALSAEEQHRRDAATATGAASAAIG